MFLKRQLPVYIMVTIGTLTLLGHFIKGGFVDTFIKEDSLNWFNIIASFAILLGAFNLLKIHFVKFAKKKKDWQYSIIALIGFTMMIVAGFFFRGGNYLKIEINSQNIGKLVETDSDSKYFLNTEVVESINSYFLDNLISGCYDSSNQKIDYFELGECIKNKGIWNNRQIDPTEFNRPLYNKSNLVLDDGFSSELKWMIYDYLDEVVFMKGYYDLQSEINAGKVSQKEFPAHCFDYMIDGKSMRKEQHYCQKYSKEVQLGQLIFTDLFCTLPSTANFFEVFTKYHFSIKNWKDRYENVKISKLFNKKSFSYSKLNNMVIEFNKIGLPSFLSLESVEWGRHVEESGTFIKWLFDSIYSPLDTTMFALLAFFVASASYRAFRIRNFEASLLLIAGVLVMIGAIPAGALIPSWFFVFLFAVIIFAFIAPLFKDRKILFVSLGATSAILLVVTLIFDVSFLNAKNIMAWIIKVPTVAGKKAIMIGVALGIVATSLRIIFGRDKSFLGD